MDLSLNKKEMQVTRLARTLVLCVWNRCCFVLGQYQLHANGVPRIQTGPCKEIRVELEREDQYKNKWKKLTLRKATEIFHYKEKRATRFLVLGKENEILRKR